MEGPTGCEARPASWRPAQADEKAPPGLVLFRDLFPGAQPTRSSAAPSLQPCFCRAGSDMRTSTLEDHPAGALASSQGESQQLPDCRLLPCEVQPGMPLVPAHLLHLPCQPQSAPTAAHSLGAAGLDAAPTVAPFSTGFAELAAAAADSPVISIPEAAREHFCSSCFSLLPEGDALAASINQANGRADGLKIQAGVHAWVSWGSMADWSQHLVCVV